MGNAIEQARKSLREGGIPIGSALAREGKLLAAITTNASKTTTRSPTPEFVACEMPEGMAVFATPFYFRR
jgi:tRNA(Arg) A34 adenosine deaminase TadA